VERRLAAVLNADVVGYSRLMSADEPGTLKLLKECEAGVIEPTVGKHKGRIVKRMGDGYLAEFGSVVDAIECALDWQAQTTEGDRSLRFRMGVHLGDIILDGEDIYGDDVNIAARLEALSQPGCITLSDEAFRQVRDRVKVEFHDLGEHEIKNIPRPLRVWEWRSRITVPSRLRNVKLPAMDKPSIVIMPFRNLTGDPNMDYFTDGLRMDIQNALVKVSGLFLIASGSAYAFRGAPPQDAACTLGATHALETILTEQFDRILDDSFDLQDEITGRVLAAINVRLVSGEQAKVWHRTLKDLRALEAFYKGVHAFYQMDRESMQRARQYFERVAEIRPDASAGATWVAMSHWFDIQRGCGHAGCRRAGPFRPELFLSDRASFRRGAGSRPPSHREPSELCLRKLLLRQCPALLRRTGWRHPPRQPRHARPTAAPALLPAYARTGLPG
jgi:adenylate cyclase